MRFRRPENKFRMTDEISRNLAVLHFQDTITSVDDGSRTFQLIDNAEINLLAPGDVVVILKCNHRTPITDYVHGRFLWNWQDNIESGHGQMPSGNKLLPEPTLAQFSAAIMASLNLARCWLIFNWILKKRLEWKVTQNAKIVSTVCIWICRLWYINYLLNLMCLNNQMKFPFTMRLHMVTLTTCVWLCVRVCISYSIWIPICIYFQLFWHHILKLEWNKRIFKYTFIIFNKSGCILIVNMLLMVQVCSDIEKLLFQMH